LDMKLVGLVTELAKVLSRMRPHDNVQRGPST